MAKFRLAKVLFIFCFCSLFSQELPPIERFTPQDYNADNQNWSISQSSNENIYVANSKGLLEYNGAKWQLYKVPNHSVVRSVKVIGDSIFTGSYMDFGYWKKDYKGTLSYKSLANDLKDSIVEDEEFWNILTLDGFILFQSLDRIYIYDVKYSSFSIIDSKTQIVRAFKVGDSIYFQEKNSGISKIENGQAREIIDYSMISDYEIINMFNQNNSLLLLTKDNGFLMFDGLSLRSWSVSASPLINSSSIYSGVRLKNGNYILGSISNGVIKINSSGDLLYHISKKQGLSNNTVLSCFQDVSGNVWLGLDNGVNVLNINSPYRVYTDTQGYLGTVYTSAKSKGFLYLGTNQGLFYRSLQSPNENFKFIKGTKGQVWILKTIHNTLFCGHDKGSFAIVNNKAKVITTGKGVWELKPIQGLSNTLILGGYDGLSVIKKASDGSWLFSNKVEGFNISSRYFEFADKNRVLVSHEYKGVYELELNKDYQKVVNYVKLDVSNSIGSSIISFEDNVFYITDKGAFLYNNIDSCFNKDDFLKTYFANNNYLSGRFIYDNSKNRYWGFFKNQILFVEPGKLSKEPIIKSITLPTELRRSKQSFENILHLNNDRYLLGTTDGYIVIDVNYINAKTYQISIDKASYSTQKDNLNPILIKDSMELANKQNHLFFDFSVPDYRKLAPSLYQYKLKGKYNKWSNWSTDSSVLFENLSHGNYEFLVRAKISNTLSSNTASLKFSIAKPWFLKPMAIITYVILFLIGGFIIQYANRLYYKRQKITLLASKERELEIKDLENQKQLMVFKNKSLQQDIENKNRELGLSTMTLIRKNEFLNQLKKELNGLEDVNGLSKIIKIIDKNINNTEDWKFFEEAFNNADKDFLKTIKKKHPELTPNDLKLCAYLRLNLSSKEIAPLLNISHRSVEVKRYRLRKKMQLEHKVSLTNYILEM